jgi:hypothetical protein
MIINKLFIKGFLIDLLCHRCLRCLKCQVCLKCQRCQIYAATFLIYQQFLYRNLWYLWSLGFKKLIKTISHRLLVLLISSFLVLVCNILYLVNLDSIVILLLFQVKLYRVTILCHRFGLCLLILWLIIVFLDWYEICFY